MKAIKSSTGHLLPMLNTRPVDPEWKCIRCGDCCTQFPDVVMTKEEAAVLVHNAPKEITLQFRPDAPGFVALKAKPCPLYIFGECVVYEHRPYSCRRFICLRPDVKTEKFEPDMSNLMDRVKTSRVARRMARLNERRAQRWARKHGWE